MDSKDLIDRSLSLVQKGITRLPEKADPTCDLEELHFELTYQCNQKCIMCDVWDRYRINPQLKKREIGLEEIIRFVDDSEYLKNIKLVLFSGGEPFLRRDIVDLCGYFLTKYPDISVGILSNLYNTRMILDRLNEIYSQYKPRNLWIGSSLDGLGEVHNKIRGVKHAFERMINTIDAVQKEFPQVKVGLNFTLTTKNFRDLMSAFEYARQHNLDFSAQFAIPWDGAEKFEWDDTQITEIEKTTNKIIEEIVVEHEKKGMLKPLVEKIDVSLLAKIYYWHGLTEYQRTQRRFFKRCVAGAKYAMISPVGDLYFCPVLKQKVVGNIRDYDYKFDNLWISEKGGRIRDFINKGLCHCWLNCTIYPNVGEAIRIGQTLSERGLITIGSKTKRFWKVVRMLPRGLYHLRHRVNRFIGAIGRICLNIIVLLYLLLYAANAYLKKAINSGKRTQIIGR